MSDTNSRVQAVIDRFVTEMSAIAREEAARVVLGGFAPAGRAHKASSNGAGVGGRGEKRSAESLEELQTKLLGFVKSHPGLRIEEINKQLGTTTRDLALPIRKLVADKQLRVQGQRRATKYFAGGNGSAKGGTKKRSKK
jgi:hypothetical protein